ncbi:pyruvate ferredoxin oxidoreductase [Candidatus Bathyarchaeota archaeon]|nr:pyruvate ferredoxin oxidoreductase [Candidatus Bathyarchaeota archaeon]
MELKHESNSQATRGRHVEILTGNHAASHAARMARVDVVSAYPITPQSPVVEKISEFIASGEMSARMIRVESEQSAMASCISASITGARVFTATSANGLAYMNEQLAWAAGTRLPLVMCVVTRALAAPWSVWTDHQDAISQRDTGWMQVFCEDNQEIYDTVLEAYKVAENDNIFLPIMVCFDGYILSHTTMPVELLSQNEVDTFLPSFNSHLKLHEKIDEPVGVNPVTLPDPREGFPGYMEFRYRLQKTIEKAIDVFEDIERDFASLSGRNHGGVVRGYKMEDADIAIVGMGSASSQAKKAIPHLREQGIKAGVLTIRLFRPFPKARIREALKNVKQVVVFDRDVAYGLEGAISAELKSALYNRKHQPHVQGFIVGLGGRDFKTEHVIHGTKMAMEYAEKNEVPDETKWLGVDK